MVVLQRVAIDLKLMNCSDQYRRQLIQQQHQQQDRLAEIYLIWKQHRGLATVPLLGPDRHWAVITVGIQLITMEEYCDAKPNTIVPSVRQIYVLCHVFKSIMRIRTMASRHPPTINHCVITPNQHRCKVLKTII